MGIYRDSGGWKFAEAVIVNGKLKSYEEDDGPTRKAYVLQELKTKIVQKFQRDSE